MAKTSLAHSARETTSAKAHRSCAGCGTVEKALTAPHPNVGHSYTGPMYCLPCNPRFRRGAVLEIR